MLKGYVFDFKVPKTEQFKKIIKNKLTKVASFTPHLDTF